MRTMKTKLSNYTVHKYELGSIKIPLGSDKLFHFLEFYSYDEGRQIMMSPSIDGLIMMLDSRTDVSNAVDINYYVGKIVNVPHEIMLSLHEKRTADVIRNTISNIATKIQTYERFAGELPPDVIQCDNFIPPDYWDVHDESGFLKELEDGPKNNQSLFSFISELHYVCQNCECTGIAKLRGKSLSEFALEVISDQSLTLDYPDYIPNHRTFVITRQDTGTKIFKWPSAENESSPTSFHIDLYSIVAFFEGEKFEVLPDALSNFFSSKNEHLASEKKSEREKSWVKRHKELQNFLTDHDFFTVDKDKLEQGFLKERELWINC